MDLTGLEKVCGMTLHDLELRNGIMGSVHVPDASEPEDTTIEQTREEGVVGPCDRWAMPLKYAYRKAFSEMELLDCIGTDPEYFREGWCYNFLSRGDVDLMSYLKLMLKQQNVNHLIVSSWRADYSDFELMVKWKEEKRIGRLDVYLGRLYAYGTERRYDVRRYRDLVERFPDVSVKVFRNHAKVIAGQGEKFNFVIQSSANLNINVNSENACIIIDKDCWAFYRDFYSNIKSVL